MSNIRKCAVKADFKCVSSLQTVCFHCDQMSSQWLTFLLSHGTPSSVRIIFYSAVHRSRPGLRQWSSSLQPVNITLLTSPLRCRPRYMSISTLSKFTIFLYVMGLLPDTYNCRLRMHRECREHFPRHRLQSKPSVSDAGMHHGTCVTHLSWCMSGSLTRGENVPGIPGACATHNFT